MSTYLHLRAVPPPALRNSATWLERLFGDGSATVPQRLVGHHEEVLDKRYLDQERIYAGAPAHRAEDRPRTQVVLGGRPVFRPDRRKPPFLVLTAAQARRVAGFLTTSDFDALWDVARDELVPRYGGVTAERETWGAFAAAHRELKTFYVQTAAHGDAVVKWLPT
nr:YfbM family protein [Streptomyces sp. NBC_00886]